MLYFIIRLVLALAAAGIAFVWFARSGEERGGGRRFHAAVNHIGVTGMAAAVFAITALALYLMPVENLLAGFSTPESAFRYNHSGEILEINEYSHCAFVIASTDDGALTTHVLPEKNGKWKLETTYNRRRDVTTLRYCIAERLYVPGTKDCFVIITHSTDGNISDEPTSVADSRNTKFTAVSYEDAPTFYYGFVSDMDEDYSVHVDGEKMQF